jgi:hypothetical protein
MSAHAFLEHVIFFFFLPFFVCEPFNHTVHCEIAHNHAIFLEKILGGVQKKKNRHMIISPFYHAWHNLDEGM